MRGTKLYAMFAAMFVAGAFLASPELRAFAANTVGSADIINESIQSVDIKNGQVKAADIGTDAVGASEIDGVTKLIFARCPITNSLAFSPGNGFNTFCNVPGTDRDDLAVASHDLLVSCFSVQDVGTFTNVVEVFLMNNCKSTTATGRGTISIIVFDAPIPIDPL